MHNLDEIICTCFNQVCVSSVNSPKYAWHRRNRLHAYTHPFRPAGMVSAMYGTSISTSIYTFLPVKRSVMATERVSNFAKSGMRSLSLPIYWAWSWCVGRIRMWRRIRRWCYLNPCYPIVLISSRLQYYLYPSHLQHFSTYILPTQPCYLYPSYPAVLLSSQNLYL